MISEYLKEYGPSLATLLAAFVGSWSAYKLTGRAQNKADRDAKLSAINGALFVLFRMINTVHLYKKDMIEPVLGSPGIHIEMRPMLEDSSIGIDFDYESLSYLLSTRHRSVLPEMYTARQSYEETIKAINFRSRLHYEQVQPALVRAGLRDNTEHTEQEYMDALGPYIYKTLQEMTNNVVVHVGRTIVKLNSCSDNLTHVACQLFTGGEVLRIELKS